MTFGKGVTAGAVAGKGVLLGLGYDWAYGLFGVGNGAPELVYRE